MSNGERGIGDRPALHSFSEGGESGERPDGAPGGNANDEVRTTKCERRSGNRAYHPGFNPDCRNGFNYNEPQFVQQRIWPWAMRICFQHRNYSTT